MLLTANLKIEVDKLFEESSCSNIYEKSITTLKKV